ncbi:MAG: N-acetylornithine carbamoyltransferase [Phaeodactylibacter sp.]|nr:N-acetylornithine carbamoyltransferase [Phaeodactylibacter sp.]
MKKFTSVEDISDVNSWVQQALQVKQQPFAHRHLGSNKTLGLLFFNPSLRTRMSTQKAAQHLGMQVIVLNLNSDGWKIELEDGTVMDQGTQEHIKEAAAVLSQYCDILGVRTFPSLEDREKDYADQVLNKFVEHASVPVISLESAILHPLQSFADAMTIEEYKKKPRPKVVLSWAPHPRALPQAVANSFVEWMSRTDVELVITHPKGFELAPRFSRGIEVVYKQEAAFEGADFIYAKNWSSYTDYGKIGKGLDQWMIDLDKMSRTNGAAFMHCLPVRRNVVVSDAVLDSDASLVIQQANNRTFAAQTVLMNLLQHGA